MKPIRLRFDGLHSYRTVQHVDFSELCTGGLFGIFGPTGSGKSTILDAMTLALYARVDRAGGTRQGILNQNEDSLFVDFTFVLGSGTDAREYQVERKYKRSGPHSVAVAYARLVVRHGGSETVLADKDGDVTNQIVQVLGLTHADFTRAVVLPQGKFAEFLGMAGTERRQMLERLFALEEYGQRLMRRIAGRRDATENHLSSVTGEQTGLGDASKDRVTVLAHELKVTAERVADARDRLDKVRAQHAAAEKKRSLQHELKAIQEQLEPLQAAEANMTRLASELSRAQAAEPIRRELEAVAQANQRHTEAIAREKQVTLRLDQAAAAHQDAARALETARSARQSAEPDLLGQRLQLEQAVKDEARRAAMQLQADQLRAAHESCHTQIEQAVAQEAKVQEQLQNDAANLKAKQVTERALAVDPERRRTIARAIATLDRLQVAETTLAQQRSRLLTAQATHEKALTTHKRIEHMAHQAQQALENLEARLARHEQDEPTDDATLAADVTFLERARAQIGQIAAVAVDLDKALAAVEAARRHLEVVEGQVNDGALSVQRAQLDRDAGRARVEQARQAERQAEVANRAAALAAELVDAEPCPVCGSSHHPAPAQSGTADPSAQSELREAEVALVSLEQALSDVLQRHALAELQLQSAKLAVTERGEVIDNLRLRDLALRAKLPEPWRTLPLAALQTEFMSEEQGLKTRQQQAQQWKQEVASVRRELDIQRKATSRTLQDLAEAASTLAASRTQFDHAQSALREAEQSVSDTGNAFAEAAHGMDATQVSTEAQAIEHADESAAKLRNDLAQLEERLALGREALDKLRAERSSLESQRALIHAELSTLTQQATELSSSLHRLTGGLAANELLAQVNDRLTRLATDEAEKSTLASTTVAELAEWQNKAAAANEGMAHAADAEDMARTRLQAELLRAGFPTPEAATQALRDDDVRAAMRQQLDTYRASLSRLVQDEQRLLALVGGERVDELAWQELQDALTATEAEHESAIGGHHALQTTYTDTLTRHEQWVALEKERSATQALKDRLDQLATLLRGNRFVEFVSEEYLTSVALDASARLGALTRHRYALEIDSSSGFIVRDDSNGGVRRPVSSLSGGETFLTSLALALALSNQIQLRGTYPLEFFFLDEGFGTLDPELLETVITSLERLQTERVNIGIISHVPELRQRVSRRLVVQPGNVTQDGSQLTFERA